MDQRAEILMCICAATCLSVCERPLLKQTMKSLVYLHSLPVLNLTLSLCVFVLYLVEMEGVFRFIQSRTISAARESHAVYMYAYLIIVHAQLNERFSDLDWTRQANVTSVLAAPAGTTGGKSSPF